MLSSEGKPTNTENHQPVPLDTASVTQYSELDYEQVFGLIETILPFEACLYHQVIPLQLQDNQLLLGVVNPDDKAALDYVNSILTYLKYSWQQKLIAPENHRSILSSYLNRKNSSQSTIQWLDAQKNYHQPELDELPTGKSLSSQPVESHSQPKDDTVLFKTTPHLKQKGSLNEELTANLPLLDLPLPGDFVADEELITITSSRKLLDELLGRILAGGIGRLYLERQPYQGRILWSQNGVVQSVIEKMPLSVFQGVLNELKRLGSLPLGTFAEAKQIEKQCLYQKQRVLLRLRVMPGMHGEQATLQVLKGTALKFYQQQLLSRLSMDTLGVSQQLSYKLHELQQRLTFSRDLKPEQLEAFSVMNELLKNLDNQIKIITEQE